MLFGLVRGSVERCKQIDVSLHSSLFSSKRARVHPSLWCPTPLVCAEHSRFAWQPFLVFAGSSIRGPEKAIAGIVQLRASSVRSGLVQLPPANLLLALGGSLELGRLDVRLVVELCGMRKVSKGYRWATETLS